MGNKRYERGYAFENKLVRYLRDCGWYATRTAGSHTATDVIGITPNGIVYLFQCKTALKEIVLTDLFNSVSVYHLTRIRKVEKVLAIRVGSGRDYIAKFYKWHDCSMVAAPSYWQETNDFSDFKIEKETK